MMPTLTTWVVVVTYRYRGSPSRGGVRIGAWASVAFYLSRASLASTVQEKHLCFFKSQ
jgi:hypothetical protein